MRADRLALAFALLAAACSPASAEYDPKGKRDPFVPLLNAEGQRIKPPGLDEEVSAGIGTLSLQGIVFDPGDSFAIINGRVIREREEIEGIKILQIEPAVVTILVEGQTHQLRVNTPTEENESEQ